MTSSNFNGNQPLVWVVDSAYTGELHARIGVADKLGYGFEIIPLPNGDSQGYRNNLKIKYREKVNGYESPLIVISGTGEETTEEIAVASPQLEGDNIVTLCGVPHQMTRERLKLGHEYHADFFSTLPKPIIGLLVGGNTRYCDGFDEQHAQRLALRVSAVVDTLSACIVMTNSRRTPPSAQAALLDGLKDHDCHFFDWQTVENTFYPALLANADLFIVTGDSLSMCSEAAFTGKPLLVDLCQRATESYHRDIVGRLIDYGAAKVLGSLYEPWSYCPPDPTEQVVKEIRARVERCPL